MTFKTERYGSEATWLKNRGVGGSDAPDIMGLPFKGGRRRAMDKFLTGKREAPNNEMLMALGHYLEPFILSRLCVQGYAVDGPSLTGEIIQFRDLAKPWRTYTPDGWIGSPSHTIVELKSPRNSARWLGRRSVGVRKAFCQAVHGCLITGARRVLVAVLRGKEVIDVYEEEVTDLQLSALEEAEIAFVAEVIEKLSGNPKRRLDLIKQWHCEHLMT